MIRSFRRSAVYMNKLRDVASMQSILDMRVRDDELQKTFEMRRSEDLERVYTLIERSARGGAVRIFDWEWSTPKVERDLLFRDDEIKNYLQSNGFSYSYNCIEWYAAKEKVHELA